ncbi:prepilin peptidase [Sporanaerobacter sp.]|uniref:prepilin peptidase n=1 Tax=Sporanaerobacter sp. TaxID=2010183 RepID=UPI003A10215F
MFISAIIYKLPQFILYDTSPNIINSILALIISSGIFLIIAIISKGGIGGGDIKLIGVLGFILGIKFTLLNIFLSFILGAIISIFLLLFKIKGKKDPIPFGPFICIAFMIVTLWGEEIIGWYIQTFIL